MPLTMHFLRVLPRRYVHPRYQKLTNFVAEWRNMIPGTQLESLNSPGGVRAACRIKKDEALEGLNGATGDWALRSGNEFFQEVRMLSIIAGVV